MATRWNRRRVTLTFLVIGVFTLFYVQQRQPDNFPQWNPTGDAPAPAFPPPPSNDQATPPAPFPQPPGDAAPPPPPADGPPPFPQHEAPPATDDATTPATPVEAADDGKFQWSKAKLHHPIPRESMQPVPSASSSDLKLLPKIQHQFGKETEEAKKLREYRLSMVVANFTHAWNGYKKYAWLSDEVRPIKGTAVVKFGGWAATLVDTLDTLWMMGMKDEFETAVQALDKIDFTTTSLDEVNVFETTIRYLGGLLSAHDLSGGKYPLILQKATEVGDMLYVAFDTPNHMPITRWKFEHAKQGQEQPPHKSSLVSEVGSFSLEFTRLSQVTGDAKYYDLVHRVMEKFSQQQDKTYIPGLWPVVVNTENADFAGASGFTIGGMADSLYEYLPKEYFLLGGVVPAYHDMYIKSLEAMKRYIFFRPNANSSAPILFPGDAQKHSREEDEPVRMEPRVQHLGCFAGGMVALGARLFDREEDMEIATQLVEGSLWAYETGPAGIMPEVFHVSSCKPATEQCEWSETEWYADITQKQKSKESETFDVAAAVTSQRLVPSVTKYDDTRYILRPEAIESIFILYRLTGNAKLMDRAWKMFETIVSLTQTDIAHTALNDCTLSDPRPSQADSMESFWLAETLKYFYLMYSSPELISLDDYVLNTEAHPFLRPKA